MAQRLVLAERLARDLASPKEYTYVSVYNDIDNIAGQETVGLETLD